MLSPNEQQDLIEQAYEDEAERLGVGSWELTLQLIATSEEQPYQRILAAHKEIAEMVNMSWLITVGCTTHLDSFDDPTRPPCRC